MRLYQAGVYTSNFHKTSTLYSRLDDREKDARDGVEWHLESYHYIHKDSFVKRIRKDGVKVFLDSGAFSAFTKGVNVDLKKYCRYIQQNEDIVDFASVLDAIGDAQGTYENQCEMERNGVRPLPCFHYNEDPRYLEYYVANYDYITLGGMVPISTKQLIYWLDELWDKYLTDGAGRPRIKVHGFGLTSLPLMKRYPWFSVDSSTWVQWAANGMLLIPGVGQINVSSKSSFRKVLNQHLETYSDQEKKVVSDIINGYGFDTKRLADLYYSRWAYNLWAFQKEGHDSISETFECQQLSLF